MSVIHPGSPTLRMRYRQGVLVTPSGFPDWALCARALVELPPPVAGLTRDEVRVVDVLAANGIMARLAATPGGDPLWAPGPAGRAVATPSGWCWAHVGGARQVTLVPIELHASYRHFGGMSLLAVGGRGQRVDATPVPVRPGPGDEVPDELVDLLERLLGGELPPVYRRFLADTNGAGPSTPGVLPGFGFVVDQPLFGIAREDRHQDLSYVPEWCRDRLTSDFLPIGYVQGGLLAVKVAGDDRDSVWYLDDDDPRDRDPYDAEHISAHLLRRCADDIDGFWTELAQPATELLRIAEDWLDSGQVVQVRDETIGFGLPPQLRAPWQASTQPARRDPLTALFEVG
ncbi:SMI1/KNR4 family protein [Micromonospora sonneratiae]|uniref:HNH endonuclease n=1 Tax=Micromonospora sonneratiae TaxID=1184706 RepID=A0ABW3YNX9_9ACTN